MTTLSDLFHDFADRHAAGEQPDAGEFLSRVHDDERTALAEMIEFFLEGVPDSPNVMSSAAPQSAAASAMVSVEELVARIERARADESLVDELGYTAELATVLRGGVRRELARQPYARLEELFAAVGDTRGQLSTRLGRAALEEDLGQIESALELYEGAVELAGRSGDDPAVAVALSSMGRLYAERAFYERALELLHRALEIHERIGDKASQGAILHQIGSLQLELASHEKATQALGQALSILTDIGDDDAAAEVREAISQVPAGAATITPPGGREARGWRDALRELRRLWGARNADRETAILGVRGRLSLTLAPAAAGAYRGHAAESEEYAMPRTVSFASGAGGGLVCTFSYDPEPGRVTAELRGLPAGTEGMHLMILFPAWAAANSPDLDWVGETPGIVALGEVPSDRALKATLGALTPVPGTTFSAMFEECRIASEEGDEIPELLITLENDAKDMPAQAAEDAPLGSPPLRFIGKMSEGLRRALGQIAIPAPATTFGASLDVAAVRGTAEATRVRGSSPVQVSLDTEGASVLGPNPYARAFIADGRLLIWLAGITDVPTGARIRVTAVDADGHPVSDEQTVGEAASVDFELEWPHSHPPAEVAITVIDA